MDFAFYWFYGTFVGEKVPRGMNHAIKTKCRFDDFKIRWSQDDGSLLLQCN
jgi:hypothetical protein